MAGGSLIGGQAIGTALLKHGESSECRIMLPRPLMAFVQAPSLFARFEENVGPAVTGANDLKVTATLCGVLGGRGVPIGRGQQ